MKIDTEVLVQPEAFRDDIEGPVAAKVIEPIGGGKIVEESKVAIKIKPSYRWNHGNCFIVDKKYCIVR